MVQISSLLAVASVVTGAIAAAPDPKPASGLAKCEALGPLLEFVLLQEVETRGAFCKKAQKSPKSKRLGYVLEACACVAKFPKPTGKLPAGPAYPKPTGYKTTVVTVPVYPTAFPKDGKPPVPSLSAITVTIPEFATPKVPAYTPPPAAKPTGFGTTVVTVPVYPTAYPKDGKPPKPSFSVITITYPEYATPKVPAYTPPPAPKPTGYGVTPVTIPVYPTAFPKDGKPPKPSFTVITVTYPEYPKPTGYPAAE